MRAPLVFAILLTLALCSCKTTTPPPVPTNPHVADHTLTEVEPTPPSSVAMLEARIAALESQNEDLRNQVEVLRHLNTRLEAQLRDNVATGPDDPKNPPATSRLQQLANIVARQSDVHRAWMGQIKGLSIVLYPMTVKEYADPVNQQLGGEYCYMVLIAFNDSPDTTWTYKPQKGLIVAQFDQKPGETKPTHIKCRDPIELIEIEENKIGRRMLETRSRFEGRELKPGEQMDTLIVFEKGTDFGAIAKLYFGNLIVQEVELPSPGK